MSRKIAFLFPGQGAQSVGMGRDLYDTFDSARQVIDRVAELTSPELKTIMFDGPEESLKRTLYTQPALLATSLAALTVFREKTNLQPVLAAGHSLGEIGALYSAGVLSLDDSARLIQKRAESMENARPGTMAAILGLSAEQVESAVAHVVEQNLGIITVANYNTAEQFVISGERAAVEAVCAYASDELKAMKTVMLPVGGAFHSALMQETNQDFNAVLREVSFAAAAFGVVTNVDAQITTEGPVFAQKLETQLYSSVRWLETMHTMQSAGIDTYIEFGPGKVLTGMLKRFDRSAKLYNVSDSASLEAVVASLNELVTA